MTLGAPFRPAGGGGVPRDRKAPAATNEVTVQQAELQARSQRRINLLKTELPGLAYANESLLIDLANGADDDADMMQAAIDSMSIADQEQMMEELKGYPADKQRGMYETMNPIKRRALEEMGWTPPKEKKGFGGWLDRQFGGKTDIKGALSLGFNPAGAAFNMLPDKANPAKWTAAAVAKASNAPGIKHVLGGMDYIAEEASRTQRILPQMQSGQRVLDETGMSSDQLYEKTGIRTTGAAGTPLVEGTTGAMMSALGASNQNPLEWIKHPSDIWRAAQTWNAIGHEGSDDILPEVQMEVFSQFEDEFGSDQAKDMLRWAKGLAAGHSIRELAEMDGMEGDQVAHFEAVLAPMAASPQFKQQVARLTSGQMSAGRTLARQVWNDPTKDVSTGAARYVSGGTDAVWNLVADPTIVVGKVSKSIKAAKWAMRSGDAAEDLSRAQELVRAVNLADEGKEGFDLAAELAKVEEKYGRKARTSKLAQVVDSWSPTTTEAQARALAAPANALAEAVKTGDYGKLVRQHPMFERHIPDIRRYDAALKAAQREAGEAATGLSRGEDAFEFYKHAATNRSVLSTVEDTARIKINSQRMFGRDGAGHLVVPHMTTPQRKVMEARESFRNWRYNLEEGTATLPTQMKQSALNDMKAVADEAHQSMVDEGLSQPFDPDDWEVSTETFTYQRKQPEGIKKAINQIIEVATTSTTKRGFVPVTDDVMVGPEEFRAFNESMGVFAGDNILVRRERYNRFVNGTIQDRHMLINQMITDMASLTGVTATEEGQQWLRRFIEHNNQIYGDLDKIAIANGENLSRTITKQAIFESQVAEALTVPSAKDMLVATRNANMFRWVTGTTRQSVLEAGMTRVWKPAQLMRLGFPLRAGADEALQFIGRVSLRDYVDKAVLQKWAGVSDASGALLRDPVTGHVIMEAQGAIKPVRSFTRSWATIFGVTDEVLDDAAREIAARNPEWFTGTIDDQRRLLAKARDEVVATKRLPSRAVRHIDQLAHDAALKSTEWFHSTAASKYVSRQKFAEGLLKARGDYAARVEANQLMYLHPIAQQGASELTGATFTGLRPGSDDPLRGVGMLAFDKDSPTRFKYVPVTTNSKEWEWVGHNDLTGFYLNMDHWMRSANQNSPAFRAIADEMLHHVPQSVVDELAVYGEDGMEVLADMRAAVADADEELSNVLMMAVDQDSTADTIREVLDERGLSTDSAIEEVIANWDQMSPKTKWMITDKQLYTNKLTTDFNLVQDRAANQAHNAMRRLDNAGNQRTLVRAQTVDGVPVAEPLRDGHTRVYGVMLDRRNAEDIVRLFNDESMMQTFAERVSEHLGAANLKKHMRTAWESALPTSEGYDFATWMAGMKANIIQGSGSYVPAMMTGSSNPAVASAIRDAIADVMPEQVLRPTIGYLDHPDDLFTEAFGMKKLDDSVVWMSPNQAGAMKFIDPDNQVKMVHVEMPDGEKIWLGETEVESIAGKRARIDSTPVTRVHRSRGMVAWDPREKAVKFNGKLMRQDFNDGMKFLRGEGGEMSVKGAVYGWDDAEYAAKAEELADVLDAHGLAANTGLDLDELIGYARNPKARTGPIPFEDVMKDNDLWVDFQELASTAKKKGTRDVETWFDQRTADESKVVKAGLDRLGINVDDLNLTPKEYQSLLILREQAHAALRPAGYRGVRTASAEAVEREADALAIAFQKAGIDPHEKMWDEIVALEGQRDELASALVPDAQLAARDAQLADLDKQIADLRDSFTPVADRALLATGEEAADYKILGEIWGNGVTEDVAMRRTAQDQLNETMGWVIGRQSGEVMSEILAPLRRGSHTQQNLWTRVALDDLPTHSFGPMRVAAGETRWDKKVRDIFDGAWDPTISGISRSPMYADAFHKASERYRVVYDNTVLKSLDARARGLLDEVGFDPEQLRDVNRIIGSQLKANPQLGEGLNDAYVEYLKAVHRGDATEAARNMARIKLGDDVPEGVEEAEAYRRAFSKAQYDFHMDEDQLKLLSKWHTNQTHAIDEWVHRSTQHALEMVAPFVDDHRIRSAMQEYLGPVVVPYLYAEEQFLRRVARGFYETPHMLRKGQLTMNGMRNIGMIREDAYGNEVFVIPGSELLMGRVADVAELITGNPAMQVLDQPLSMRTDFVLPGWNTGQSRWGWGPIIGLSTDQITQRYPEYEWRSDDPNRPWWSYVVPGPVSGFYKAFMDQGDPTQLASAQIAAISYLEANGHGLPDNATASQKEDYLENVRQVSRTIGVIRYATGQMSFSAAGPFDAEAMMRKEFTDLLASGLDYGDAIDRFIEEHGPEAMVYTVFGTTNETGAPLFNTTTEEALNWMMENDTLVQDNPSAMAWLLPQGNEKTPFDRRAYNEQLALGLRTRKSPEEMVDAVRVKQAAEDYWEAKGNYEAERNVAKDKRDAATGDAKRALQEQLNRLDSEWKTWKDGYMAKHPSFAESLTQDASDRRKKTLDDLRWLLESGVGGEQAEVVKPMVEAYHAFTAEYSAYSNQNSKAAQRIKEAMLKDYFDEQWLYVKQNPKAAPFWNSVIRPELPDTADPLVRESEALGGA